MATLYVKNEDEEHLFWIILLLLLLPIMILIGGIVTKTLWWWFLVPLGVKGIEISHAIGISCLITWFSHSSEHKKSSLAILINFIVKLGTIMLIAFIAKSCMS